MTQQQLLKERLDQIEQRIAAACKRAGRERSEVKIIAVTKYVDETTIGDLLEIGVDHIGENRVQDALPKYEKWGDRGVWHFIGHLQTNKVKEVIGRFAYIHSLDRLSLAEAINKRGEALDLVVPCFLQVNISGEETKFGLSPNDVLAFLRETSNMRHIRIAGLMTMAPHVENPEETRPVFQGLREWKERINEWDFPHANITELSMGMSNDFEVAIEEGATYIRLGSVLVKPV
ncbi:YggS family pyridoxal phosphate-dependent enzyme [Brevibacillus composti]|uniref:Pyridoxal phosphate homeostasis protein n=1 Tax=Brevibacillus composti TaxID=2796470 RepID=A0A7T5JPY2_9BACL|nr:YggS family pyridoxal phosphate-dependent enzyme [Brevibacillus composti]QQE75913.1 YggS family pyridoxal phosphate-dependent enzyme [Brevibacillus composti]QUO42939.1 YggS family pyridoxal phosphate-dependent enzyme [Brevibacillus composti]